MNRTAKLQIGSVLLIFLMVTKPSYAQRDTVGFKDVPKNHWAWNSIIGMTQSGVIEGDPQDHFRGDDAMTRYEYVVSLSRLLTRTFTTPIDYSNTATKADVNQVLERLTAIENRLSELEKKVAVAPVSLKTDDLTALNTEVKTVVMETSSLVQRVAD